MSDQSRRETTIQEKISQTVLLTVRVISDQGLQFLSRNNSSTHAISRLCEIINPEKKGLTRSCVNIETANRNWI